MKGEISEKSKIEENKNKKRTAQVSRNKEELGRNLIQKKLDITFQKLPTM